MSAFIPQDDLLLSTMTVRECIQFTASLRMPTSMPQSEKDDIVEQIISELSLEGVAHSLIGDSNQRGISGGERKRVCIGMELVHSPQFIFLDEPLSGLDSYTAFRVLQTLKRLVAKGRTIILSIHQPSSKCFFALNSILLLANGHVTFHGPPQMATEYFSLAGFPCPKVRSAFRVHDIHF